MPRKRTREAAESAQVDGDKKAEGGYVSKMRMDDMPFDCVKHVLSFLPITDVYKCKSVCRTWQEVANYVISHCTTLTLAYKWASNCPGAPHQNRIILNKPAVFINRQARARPMFWSRTKTETTDAATWIKRLEQLVRLKEIFVTGCFW